MREETFTFGDQQALIGVLSYSEEMLNPELPTVLLLNAGLIHHIGPNRVYVKLARQLADQGFLVMRFDLSGIGDSLARQDNLPFERSVIDDVQQAMAHLKKTRDADQFLLMGHCAGAVNSLRVANADERVVAAVVINPEGTDEGWSDYDRKRKLARYYQNYYGKEVLRDPKRWMKLLTGKASYKDVARNLVQNILWNKVTNTYFKAKKRFQGGASKTDAHPMLLEVLESLKSIAQRQLPLMFVYSEGSTGLERIKLLLEGELRDLQNSPHFQIQIVPQADHTFTLRLMQDRLVETITAWTETEFAGQFVTGVI